MSETDTSAELGLPADLITEFRDKARAAKAAEEAYRTATTALADVIKRMSVEAAK